jgi:hypothetical protein
LVAFPGCVTGSVSAAARLIRSAMHLWAPLWVALGSPLGGTVSPRVSLGSMSAVSREELPPLESPPNRDALEMPPIEMPLSEVQCEHAIQPSNASGRRQLARSRLVRVMARGQVGVRVIGLGLG